ncbi:MAG TPA: hypothetical protein VK880_12585 [Anaerolineales bacterium]|nr:hypothetical protein [Anaerolineales bacterium]
MSEIKRPVFFSGENPGMSLYLSETEQLAAVASYWYCTDSPWGVGHALVLWLGKTSSAGIGQGGVFTDNLRLAQILVKDLTQHFPEFLDIPVSALAYVAAHCEHTYDGACYRVMCQTPETKIEIEWSEVLDRKQVIWPQFPAGKTVYDLTTVICPCQDGGIQINGKLMPGKIKTTQTATGAPSSTAFLAFAETWIGPLDKKD